MSLVSTECVTGCRQMYSAYDDGLPLVYTHTCDRLGSYNPGLGEPSRENL
jgi:hypothetical protein